MTEAVSNLPRHLLAAALNGNPRVLAAFEAQAQQVDATKEEASDLAAATQSIQNAPLLTLAPNAALTNGRVLQVGSGVKSVDDGNYLTVSASDEVPHVMGGFRVQMTAQGPTNLVLPLSGTLLTQGAVGTDVQAHDADLDALAALTGTNIIYYRSAANTWSPVTIGSGLSFTAGTLAASGGSSVTSVTGTAPIVSSGGATPSISITPASGAAAGSMSAADFTKLAGVAAGATANSTDAFLLARGNHTGTQLSTTVSDFTEAAQDATGAMIDGSLVYVDATPLLSRAALTGDATAAQGSNALTLATVNSNVGSFGSATQTATFTVNAKGLTTAAANVTITPAVGSITGLGTGVATALGVAVGSAGAFVVFNGALGTPSSGTLTNCTFPTLNQSTTGNAGTATKLATARNINGVAFDGSADITINAVDSTARVPASRQIATTAPLTGGGDLSADRTLAISAATSSAAGSMSATDKAKLDGYPTGYASTWVSGRPLGTGNAFMFIMPSTCTLTAANCVGKAGVAATASSVFNIKNAAGTTIGTMTFAAAGTTATFTFSSPNVTAGDMIYMVVSGTRDTTLADVAVMLRS